jgi:hypothetical protein
VGTTSRVLIKAVCGAEATAELTGGYLRRVLRTAPSSVWRMGSSDSLLRQVGDQDGADSQGGYESNQKKPDLVRIGISHAEFL